MLRRRLKSGGVVRNQAKASEIERSYSKFDAAFIHNRKERGVRNLAEICRNVDLLQSFFFFFSPLAFFMASCNMIDSCPSVTLVPRALSRPLRYSLVIPRIMTNFGFRDMNVSKCSSSFTRIFAFSGKNIAEI